MNSTSKQIMNVGIIARLKIFVKEKREETTAGIYEKLKHNAHVLNTQNKSEHENPYTAQVFCGQWF